MLVTARRSCRQIGIDPIERWNDPSNFARDFESDGIDAQHENLLGAERL